MRKQNLCKKAFYQFAIWFSDLIRIQVLKNLEGLLSLLLTTNEQSVLNPID